MPGETFSKVGQGNISVCLGGMQQYSFTVVARDTRAGWGTLFNPFPTPLKPVRCEKDWVIFGKWLMVQVPKFHLFNLCVKADRAVSKSQEKSLNFPLDHLACTTFPHLFKYIPLPLSFQLTKLWDATVFAWANGLSQAVSYLNSFWCCCLRPSERWVSRVTETSCSCPFPRGSM